MKLIYSITVLFFLSTHSYGQNISMPADSVKTLLCHKWGISRVTLRGKELTTFGEKTIYEFFKDGSFKIEAKKTEKGTWKYDANKKWVHLNYNKKSNLYIISLKEGELQLTGNKDKELVSGEPLVTVIFFKIIP